MENVAFRNKMCLIPKWMILELKLVLLHSSPWCHWDITVKCCRCV